MNAQMSVQVVLSGSRRCTYRLKVGEVPEAAVMSRNKTAVFAETMIFPKVELEVEVAEWRVCSITGLGAFGAVPAICLL